MLQQTDKQPLVGVVDYGCGNIQSLTRALDTIGYGSHRIRDGDEDIEKFKIIVLPGVGAFDHAMTTLDDRGLREPLKRFASDNCGELFGICLGMQLFLDSSEEGELQGLGLLPGNSKEFTQVPTPLSVKCPNIGWSRIRSCNGEDDKEGQDWMYFVHSYYVTPEQDHNIWLKFNFGGQDFCAGVTSTNVSGVQFHPEKSGSAGLKFLKQHFGNLLNGIGS